MIIFHICPSQKRNLINLCVSIAEYLINLLPFQYFIFSWPSHIHSAELGADRDAEHHNCNGGTVFPYQNYIREIICIMHAQLVDNTHHPVGAASLRPPAASFGASCCLFRPASRRQWEVPKRHRQIVLVYLHIPQQFIQHILQKKEWGVMHGSFYLIDFTA